MRDESVERMLEPAFDEEVDPSEVAATLNGAFQEAPDGRFQRQFVTAYVAQQLLSRSPPRWENLAACYDVLVGLKPNDPQIWLRAAALSVYSGNLDRYHQLCGEMLAKFRGADDASVCETIAKACLISMPGQSDLSAIQAMSDKALTADPGAWAGWFQHYARAAKALAEYGSGSNRRSIELARESLAESAYVPPWLEYLSPGVPALRLSWAVAAMAHMRLGEHELASKNLEAFTQFLQEQSPLHTGEELRDDWHDWLICEILQREITQDTASLHATNESTRNAR